MYEALAEAYDESQEARNDPRRAHRGRKHYLVGQFRGFSPLYHLVDGEYPTTGRGICGLVVDRNLYGATSTGRINCDGCKKLVAAS